MAVGALVGLVLPVPLVLLLGAMMFPGPWTQAPGEARVSPVLDFEERMHRVSYRRSCASSADCEAPLGCLFDVRIGARYCTDSECMTDVQCPGDLVCRSVASVGEGPLLRLCVPVGVRREGERCVELARDKGAACGPGLLCGGREGWCGRTCRPGQPGSCPEGFFCAGVTPKPVCLPTCEGRPCPEGRECVRFEDGASSCVEVYGPSCQQTPCAGGRECAVLDEPRRPGRVWMECVAECGEGHPPCPEGLVCNRWHCLPPCDPQVAGACARGYRCAQESAEAPWVCQPDR